MNNDNDLRDGMGRWSAIIAVAVVLILFVSAAAPEKETHQAITLPDYESEAKKILEGECGATSRNERTRLSTYIYEGEDRAYTFSVITTDRGNRYFFYYVIKGATAEIGGHYFIHTAHAASDGVSPYKIPRDAWDHALDEEGNASLLMLFEPHPARSRLSDCRTWRPWDKFEAL